MTKIYIIQRIIPYESETVLHVTYHKSYAKYAARKLQNTLLRQQSDIKYRVLECELMKPIKENFLLKNEETFFGVD